MSFEEFVHTVCLRLLDYASDKEIDRNELVENLLMLVDEIQNEMV